MVKLLALIGFNKSGKDECGKYLTENILHGYKRIAFGDKVKEQFSVENLLSMDYIEEHKTELRPKIIELGESRREINPMYWVDKVKDNIIKNDTNLVITDLRRVTEVEYLLSLDKIYYDVSFIRVIRPKFNKGLFENDPKTALTICYLEYHSLIKGTIINDTTIENLYNKIDKWK